MNADLFYEVFSIIEYLRLKVLVRWMPSHLDKNPQSEWPNHVSWFDVRANGHADKLADDAAEALSATLDKK